MQVPNPAYDPAGSGDALKPTITEQREVRVPNVTGGVAGHLVNWGADVGDGAFDKNALLAMVADVYDPEQWTELAPGEVGVFTDEDGTEGAQYLASYRVRLYATHIDDKGTADVSDDNHWLLTRSHMGDDRTIDSDVLDRGTLTVIDRVAETGGDRGDGSRVDEGRIILAGVTDKPDRDDQGSHVPVPGQYVQSGQNTIYDWLTLRKDGGVGLRLPELLLTHLPHPAHILGTGLADGHGAMHRRGWRRAGRSRGVPRWRHRPAAGPRGRHRRHYLERCQFQRPAGRRRARCALHSRVEGAPGPLRARRCFGRWLEPGHRLDAAVRVPGRRRSLALRGFALAAPRSRWLRYGVRLSSPGRGGTRRAQYPVYRQVPAGQRLHHRLRSALRRLVSDERRRG